MNFLIWMDLAAFIIFGGVTVTSAPHTAWYFAGLAISAIAFPLWMLARKQLGKSFVVRAEARALVTTGLYSKIRNPIYLFGALAFAGLFIAWANLIAVVFFLIFNAFQIVRIKREQTVLEKAFGEEYRRYKASTWF